MCNDYCVCYLSAMDDLTETELLYTDLVEVAINYLQEEIVSN